MKFYEALWIMFNRAGSTITNWDGRTVGIHRPQNGDLPYLYMESSKGKGPWAPSQVDMFSDTWRVS